MSLRSLSRYTAKLVSVVNLSNLVAKQKKVECRRKCESQRMHKSAFFLSVFLQTRNLRATNVRERKRASLRLHQHQRQIR